MAIVRAGDTPITLDPNELSLRLIATGGTSPGGAFISPPTVGIANANQLRLEYKIDGGRGTYVWDLFGSGLTYSPAFPLKGSPAPDITGGTLNRLVDQFNKVPGSIDISGFSVPAATLWSQIKSGDNLGAVTGILAGNDTIIGSNQRVDGDGQPIGDHLFGYGGNDFISAGAGFDILVGGPGNDYLDGGIDTDRSVYGGVSSNYKIFTYAGTTAVISNPAVSNEGIDKLVNVEDFLFADRTINPSLDTFNPLDYIASYADLRAAFGANAAAGFDHFIYAGANDGRTVTFNGLEYIASYADLRAAFGTNEAAGASHFITNGANEGRRVTFDALDYIASYRDLIAAFGVDENAGAAHYIAQGASEGRTVTFNGLNYIASYGDLIAAFHGQIAANPNDDIGATHFITAGSGEGRTVTFDPVAYELANPDIAAAFGANLEAATVHYITQGFFEGRLIA